MFAPKGTPAETVQRINADMKQVLSEPKTVQALMAAGAEPAPNTPEEFRAFLANEITKWGEIIKRANIKADD